MTHDSYPSMASEAAIETAFNTTDNAWRRCDTMLTPFGVVASAAVFAQLAELTEAQYRGAGAHRRCTAREARPMTDHAADTCPYS